MGLISERNMRSASVLKIILGITLVQLTAGCISINEDKLGKAFGEGFGHIMRDAQSIVFSAGWYYQSKNEWPHSREELEEFIKLHKAPIDLARFSEITFTPDENGDLVCEYAIDDRKGEPGKITRTDMDVGKCTIKGKIKITKEGASNKDMMFPFEKIREIDG